MIDSLAPAPAPEQSALPHEEATGHAPARASSAARSGRARRAALSGLCVAGWSASVLVGHHLDTSQDVHRMGLCVHILALVVSFGAILVIDWIGLLWLLGKREIH